MNHPFSGYTKNRNGLPSGVKWGVMSYPKVMGDFEGRLERWGLWAGQVLVEAFSVASACFGQKSRFWQGGTVNYWLLKRKNCHSVAFHCSCIGHGMIANRRTKTIFNYVFIIEIKQSYGVICSLSRHVWLNHALQVPKSENHTNKTSLHNAQTGMPKCFATSPSRLRLARLLRWWCPIKTSCANNSMLSFSTASLWFLTGMSSAFWKLWRSDRL